MLSKLIFWLSILRISLIANEFLKMSLNTTHRRFSLHSVDPLESVRYKWHFMLFGVLLPVVCVASLLENALAIAVLLRVRTGQRRHRGDLSSVNSARGGRYRVPALPPTRQIVRRVRPPLPDWWPNLPLVA